MARLFTNVPLDASASSPTEVRFRIPSDPVTLDWNKATGASETFVLMNIMQGLVQEDGNLRPSPALAAVWKTSDEGRHWSFELKAGLNWSDGAPLRAQHFRDSWIRLMDPKTQSPFADFLDDIVNAKEFRQGKVPASAVGIQVQGDRVIEVRLKRPSPWFLHLLTFWPTFPIRLDQVKGQPDNWGDPARLVTLGNWKLASWKKGARIELVRNLKSTPLDSEGSKGGMKPFERVVLTIEKNDSKARKDFEAGRTDFLLDATTADLMKKSDMQTRVEQFPYLATHYLGFVTSRPPLSNKELRKALALAIEPESLPSLLQGGQKVAHGLIPPGIDGHESGAALRGSSHEARAALVRAGFREGEGLAPLRLSIRRFDGAEKLAAHLSTLWRERLGIEVKAEVNDAEVHQRLIQSGKVDLFVQHWGADFPDAANFFEVFRTGAGSNRTGWGDAEFDRIVEEARDLQDPRVRAERYQQAERILLQDQVAIFPLFHRKNTVLVGRRVGSLKISPLNYLFFDKILAADSSKK